MKTILITIGAIIALVFVIKKVRNMILNFQLHKANTYNKDNLDGYLNTLLNKSITSMDIDVLSGLIHKQLVSSFLFNAHCNNSFKGALMMIEDSILEQTAMIIKVKEYFKNTIFDKQKSIEELRILKEEGLNMAHKEMEEFLIKL